jgi:hypothetical protein
MKKPQTLLEGKKYTCSAETDVAKTIARERKRLKDEAERRQEAIEKISRIPVRIRA